jgi:hypothetical protein
VPLAQCPFAQIEIAGDFLVGLACAQPGENLAFARGQARRLGLGRLRGAVEIERHIGLARRHEADWTCNGFVPVT